MISPNKTAITITAAVQHRAHAHVLSYTLRRMHGHTHTYHFITSGVKASYSVNARWFDVVTALTHNTSHALGHAPFLSGEPQ